MYNKRVSQTQLKKKKKREIPKVFERKFFCPFLSLFCPRRVCG